jgi:hypothetical protein
MGVVYRRTDSVIPLNTNASASSLTHQPNIAAQAVFSFGA